MQNKKLVSHRARSRNKKESVFLKAKVSHKGLMPLTPQAIPENEREKGVVNMCELYIIFYRRQKPEEVQ